MSLKKSTTNKTKQPKKAVKKATNKVVKKKSAKKVAKVSAVKEAKGRQAKKSAKKKVALTGTKKSKADDALEASDDEKKALVLGARKRKSTPSIFKIRRKATPIVFTLEEVQEIIKKSPSEEKTAETKGKGKKAMALKAAVKAKDVKKRTVARKTSKGKRVLGAASLSDILGFNPNDKKQKSQSELEESQVEKKFIKHYKALIALRTQVKEGLDMHTQDTLKRSSKEDSGDLSSYSQHMADAGTDTFDRDFALSLLSSEQDALFEIEEAIQRILNGTYGVCEITGKTIAQERLRAVPFTRYSLEGQKQLESMKPVSKDRGGVFAESSLEESAKYTDTDTEN